MRRCGRFSETELFWAALVVPSFFYAVVLHLQALPMRLGALSDGVRADWKSALALSAMWLAFDAAFALFAAALLVVPDRRGKLWMALAVLFQLAALLVAVVDTASHVYFLQSFDALDWPLFRHVLAQPQDLALLMAGEVTAGQWTLVGAVFLLILFAPWMARARATRAALANEQSGRGKAAIAMLLGATLAVLGLGSPAVAVKEVALVRSPVLFVAQTALGFGPQIDPVVDEAVAGQRFFQPGRLAIERTSDAQRRNLVVVVLESVRATATTPYQPSLATTPFLQSLAARSLLAEKAYAVVPSTAKALTAILCSLYPSVSLNPRSLTPELLGRCLPELLREQGYQTVYLQSANEKFENRVEAVRNMGFETFIRPGEMPRQSFEVANFLGYEDDIMLGPSERWLRAHRGRPFFAAYLTVNAHHDYNRLSRHGEHHFAPADDALDRYLNNVHADDEFLRALFAQYESLGLAKSTLFVIVGDHGEAFGEHGRRAHNTVPYEEGLHVPLLIHDPSGELPPGRVAGPVSQLDIMPTVLQLLGLNVTTGTLHGVPLSESPPDRVLMSSCMGTCATRVTATEAFVHHFGRRADELFDLGSDPLERNDLAQLYPRVVAARAEEIRTFQRRIGSFFFLHVLHAAHAPAAGR